MPGEKLVDVSQYTPNEAATKLMQKAAELGSNTKLEDIGLAQFGSMFSLENKTLSNKDIPGLQGKKQLECVVISFQGQEIGYMPKRKQNYINHAGDNRIIETQEQFNRILVLCMYELAKTAAEKEADEAAVNASVKAGLTSVLAETEVGHILDTKGLYVKTPREIQSDAADLRRQTNKGDRQNERAENVLHQNTRLLVENMEQTLITMGNVQVNQLRAQMTKLKDELDDYMTDLSKPGVDPFNPAYATELGKIKARLKYTLAGFLVEIKEHEIDKPLNTSKTVKLSGELYELAKTAGFDTRGTRHDNFLWKALYLVPVAGKFVKAIAGQRFGSDIKREMEKYQGTRNIYNYDPLTGGYTIDNKPATQYDKDFPKPNRAARRVATRMGGAGAVDLDGDGRVDETGAPYTIADDLEAYDSKTQGIIEGYRKKYGMDTPGIKAEYVDADGDGDSEPRLYYNLNQIPDRLLAEIYLQSLAEVERGGALGNNVEARKHEIAILKRFVKNPGEKDRWYTMLSGDGQTSDDPEGGSVSASGVGRERIFDIFKSTMFDEATQKRFWVEYRTRYNSRNMALSENYFNLPSEQLKNKEAIMINTFVRTFFDKYPMLAWQSEDPMDMASANPRAMGSLLQVFSPEEMVTMIERNCTSVDLNKDPGLMDTYSTKGLTGTGGTLDVLKFEAYKRSPALGKVVGFFTDGLKMVGKGAETIGWIGAGLNAVKTAWKGAGAVRDRMWGGTPNRDGVTAQATTTLKRAGGAAAMDMFVNDPSKSALPMQMMKEAAAGLGRNDEWKAEADTRAINASPRSEAHDDKVDPEVQMKQSLGVFSLRQLIDKQVLSFTRNGDPLVDARRVKEENPTFLMQQLDLSDGSATMYKNMGGDFAKRLFSKGINKEMTDHILAHPELANTPLAELLERYDRRIDTVKNIEMALPESSGVWTKEDKLMFHFLPEAEYKEKIQVLAFTGQQMQKLTSEEVLGSYIGSHSGSSADTQFVVPGASYKNILQRLTDAKDVSGKPALTYLQELLRTYVQAPNFAARTAALNTYFKVLRTVYSDPDTTLEADVVKSVDAAGNAVTENALRWDYGTTHPTMFERSLAGYFHSTDATYGGGLIENLTIGARGVRTGSGGFESLEITHIDHTALEGFIPPSAAEMKTNNMNWENIDAAPAPAM